MDANALGIPRRHPSSDFGHKLRATVNPSGKPLSYQCRKFYRDHLEPTGMFRCVVKHSALRPSPCGRRIERLIQRAVGVRVQVILHSMHHGLISTQDLRGLHEKLGIVLLGAA